MPAPLPTSLKPSYAVRPMHGALLLSALLILWIGNYSDLDLALADRMFNTASNAFPWRDAWLTYRFNHVLLKIVLQVMGVLVVGTAVWDWLRPRPRWSAARRTGVRVLAWSAIAIPVVISTLKRFSVSHCPWDLQRYGGSEPYIRLLEQMPAGVPAGHCMPAGHASSALWLLGVAVFWLPHQPRKAAAVAVAMLAFGFVVGWMQQMRGAHFLTHTLWSIWIAVLLVDLLYQWLKPKQA